MKMSDFAIKFHRRFWMNMIQFITMYFYATIPPTYRKRDLIGHYHYATYDIFVINLRLMKALDGRQERQRMYGGFTQFIFIECVYFSWRVENFIAGRHASVEAYRLRLSP